MTYQCIYTELKRYLNWLLLNPKDFHICTQRIDIIQGGRTSCCKLMAKHKHLKTRTYDSRKVFTREHEDKVAFFSSFSSLSNHHPSPNQIKGLKISCSEQYFMLAKARAFGEEAQAQ